MNNLNKIREIIWINKHEKIKYLRTKLSNTKIKSFNGTKYTKIW